MVRLQPDSPLQSPQIQLLPAHENVIIDLFAAETGFVLAETVLLLGTTLDSKIRQRVHATYSS